MRRRIRGVEVHLHSFLTRAPGGLHCFSMSVALFSKKNIVYISVQNLILTDLRFWSILYIKKAAGFSTYGATWRHKRQHQNPITYRLECLISYLTDFLQCAIKVPLCIWRSWNRASLDVYFIHQRDATYTVFFIIISVLHVSGDLSAHHQELIKLYVQPWVLSCFPAVYRWCGWVPTHPHQR